MPTVTALSLLALLMPLSALLSKKGINDSRCSFKVTAFFTKMACPILQAGFGDEPQVPFIDFEMTYGLIQTTKDSSNVLPEESYKAKKKVPAVEKGDKTDHGCWDGVVLAVTHGSGKDKTNEERKDLFKSESRTNQAEYADFEIVNEQYIGCDEKILSVKMASEPLLVRKEGGKFLLVVSLVVSTSKAGGGEMNPNEIIPENGVVENGDNIEFRFLI